jgi:hypothetical protein
MPPTGRELRVGCRTASGTLGASIVTGGIFPALMGGYGRFEQILPPPVDYPPIGYGYLAPCRRNRELTINNLL